MKVAIIGTGLAGISAARALIKRGIKPVILDYGLTDPDKSKGAQLEILSQQKAADWDPALKKKLFANPTVKNFPKKLSFGSDYFYGRSLEHAEVNFDRLIPPFSYARGGLSAGWGAAVLSPAQTDLADWPIASTELDAHFRAVLQGLPYSARRDDLANYFPIYSDQSAPLKLSAGNEELLADLRRSQSRQAANEVVFGQSRLLTRAITSSAGKGCQYCGQCMSGCVYGCIYNAADSLAQMIGAGEVEYRTGLLVESLSEKDSEVEVHFRDTKSTLSTARYDKVFLAAGAVNSARIVLQSKNIFDVEVPLLTTTAFIAPLFRWRKLPDTWPDMNTQPALFIEYKVRDLSTHWFHAQLSAPNELVYEKLGLREEKVSPMARLKRHLLGHMLVTVGNLPSRHSSGYLLQLKREAGRIVLHSRFKENPEAARALRLAQKKFSTIAARAGWHLLTPLMQNTLHGGGYHVGGTLPMREKPAFDWECNTLGNPKDWRRIHVVDSSLFPDLPATTIGLLAMANAHRIATLAPL